MHGCVPKSSIRTQKGLRASTCPADPCHFRNSVHPSTGFSEWVRSPKGYRTILNDSRDTKDVPLVEWNFKCSSLPRNDERSAVLNRLNLVIILEHRRYAGITIRILNVLETFVLKGAIMPKLWKKLVPICLSEASRIKESLESEAVSKKTGIKR